MKLTSTLYQIYFKTTGYSYTNLGRLFLRLFVGLMLAQFGIRQLMNIPDSPDSIPYLTTELPLAWIIIIEIICSFLIMIGFLTRLMLVPPFILMVLAAHYVFSHMENINLFICDYITLTVPFLFMGIYFFLMVVGPGKISIDYFFSLYLINRQKGKEEDLEEV